MSEFANSVEGLEICRLCLNLTVVKMNIFTEDFAKMIEILTCLKINPEDNLPKVSCLKCARDVKSAFLTRRRIIQSYRIFQSKINRLGLGNNRSNTNSPSRSAAVNTNAFLSGQISEKTTKSLKTIIDKTIQDISPSISLNTIECNTKASADLEKLEDNSNDSLSGKISETGSNFQLSTVTNEINDSDQGNEQMVKETNPVKSLELEIDIPIEKTMSAKQSEKIQSLKLDVNTRYIEKLKSMEAKQKINAWKLMNKKDQVNVLKWMEKKKVKSKNITTRLASTTQKREPVKLYCNHCEVKFNNKITFRNHMTRHKHKTCPVCNKQIRSAYLNKHMTLHEDAPVICEICGQTCKNPCSLRMHFFYYHKNPNFCVCEDCGRSFRTKTKLVYHQRKDHTKERNFKCETCGKTFFLKMYLTKHIDMKHMKLRPHICEYCGKGFSGKHALRTHVRQHTNEAPYQCNFCGERFRQRVSLRGHLKSRHKIEEENKVFCDACGKGFASAVALDVHSRLHSEIKCPWCSDTFAEKQYLEQHVSTSHPDASEDNVVDDGGFRWMNL